jgi:hypothetical protein
MAELAMIGISAYTSSFGNLSEEDAEKEQAITRQKGITSARNYVHGLMIEDGAVKKYPVGVRLLLNEKVFEGMAIADNTLDIPDCVTQATAHEFAVAYENALVFIPWHLFIGGQNKDAWKNITVHNNRRLSGECLRLKTSTEGSNKSWDSYSTRLQASQSACFDGAARLCYDEFLGVTPASSLGWTNASGNGGSSCAGTPTAEHPGVMKLAMGAQAGGYARLKLPCDCILLAAGGRAHILDFGVRCGVGAAEYYFGLSKDGSPVGAYFRFCRADGGYKLHFICHDADDDQQDYDLWQFDWSALWMRYRMEIAADASEIRLYRNNYNYHVSTVEAGEHLTLLRTVTEAIPIDTSLGFHFKVAQHASETNCVLEVDYFQHQVM